jgi:type I restriction enzyme R subunit
MNGCMESRIQVFDPQQEVAILQRRLPHWSQAGTVCYITWRTWDSIPKQVLQKWLFERNEWLQRHGIDVVDADWRVKLARLGPKLLHEFERLVSDRWNAFLDSCYGACVLRQPALSEIVADSLLCFDGDRYDLTDYVVMPNHVHLLVAFPDDDCMTRQCESWKHFTATQINGVLKRTGKFWQQDDFDHLVRSLDQFHYLRRYIANNPRRARLSPTEFKHMSKPM